MTTEAPESAEVCSLKNFSTDLCVLRVLCGDLSLTRFVEEGPSCVRLETIPANLSEETKESGKEEKSESSAAMSEPKAADKARLLCKLSMVCRALRKKKRPPDRGARPGGRRIKSGPWVARSCAGPPHQHYCLEFFVRSSFGSTAE